jgi:hypothetical protein
LRIQSALEGGNVKNAARILAWGTLGLLGAGLWLAGCKSGPELTQANALALIQANYDQRPAVPANIRVDDLGMRQGISARYWERTKVFPNNYWGDFTLTPAGKKALKLPDGSSVIQWRPENAQDKHYAMTVVSLTANHLKAHDLKEIEDTVLPSVAIAKEVEFTEGVNLDGVPSPLQQIAHNPGNKLSTKRLADFSFENGAWKLLSIN